MLKGQPTWFEWTADTLKNGEKLGYDPFLLTIGKSLSSLHALTHILKTLLKIGANI